MKRNLTASRIIAGVFPGPPRALPAPPADSAAKHRMDVVEFDALCDRITELHHAIRARRQADPLWVPWVVRDARLMFSDEMGEFVAAVARMNGRTVDELLDAMFTQFIRDPDRWCCPDLFVEDPGWVRILPGAAAEIAERVTHLVEDQP